ncbi:hypothetical protein SAMN04489868_1621, partial [Pisciglobus halotolerans]
MMMLTQTHQEGAVLMSIIQEMMETITKEMKLIFDQAVSGKSAFNDVIFDIQELMRKSGVELAEDLFSLLDETINESTQRKKDWHIQRKADEKVVST